MNDVLNSYRIAGSDIEVVTTCPCCGTDNANAVSLAEVYLGNTIILVTAYCRACGFVYREVRPTLEWFTRSWEERARILDSKVKYDPRVPLELRRYHRYTNLADALERLGCDRRVVDIGCGPGTGLRAFSDRGWSATGIEPDPSRALIAREIHGLNVIEGIAEEVEGSSLFGTAIIIHTLEHMHDILGFLQRVCRLVVPGGSIYIEVPDIRDFVSWGDALYLEHMSNFSQFTLSVLAARLGLEPRYRFWPKTRQFGNRHLGILFSNTGAHPKSSSTREPAESLDMVRSLYRKSHPCKDIPEGTLRYSVPVINDICLTFVARLRKVTCEEGHLLVTASEQLPSQRGWKDNFPLRYLRGARSRLRRMLRRFKDVPDPEFDVLRYEAWTGHGGIDEGQ